jgi:predicted SAM-dependent methyltransferase
MINRHQYIFESINPEGKGLEFGPSYNPIAPKSKGYNVEIVDVASAEELRLKYTGHRVNLDSIEEVDYIWKGEPLHELIGKTGYYDWIIASHAIEHLPDLIVFFKECELLLKDKGILALVIPDKRYCFDYFVPITTTGNLLDAFCERRIRPTSGQIFDHYANASIKSDNVAWGIENKGEPDRIIHDFEAAKQLYRHSQNSNEYIDVHCWRFTPSSFKMILDDLNRLELTNFTINRDRETEGCEFYVSLNKGGQLAHETVQERKIKWKKINMN